MNNVELPVSDNIPIKTYNHHAFGLGILMVNPNASKWLYNNYILLSYYGDNNFLTFDFYMDYIYCQPVFEREHIDDDILELRKINRMKYIIDAIESKRYVVMCVNELFIPNTLAFCSFNFNHNIMIYGYDERKKIFKIMGYDIEQKSTTWNVSYKDIRNASPHNITLLRARENYEYHIYPEYILKQVGIFLGYIEIEPVGCYPSKMRYVGVKACQKLLEDISKVISNKKELDIKPFSILKEYSRLMYARMCCLYEKKMSINVPAFSDVADMFEGLMNRVMIYNMRLEESDGKKVIFLFTKAIQELKNVLNDVYINN